MSELKATSSGEIRTRNALLGYWWYEKSEADKVIAHNKHKRCLAMASKCRLRARWFGDNAFYKKEQWALQWHKRWLKIAEKFKPNNSTAQ